MRRNICRKTLALAVILGIGSAHGSQTDLNARWFVERALAHSDQLAALRADLSRQQVEVDIAKDGRLPSLNGFVEQSSGSETRQQLRLSQTLFDWGVTSDTINAAKTEVRELEAEYIVTLEAEVQEVLELVLLWSSAQRRETVFEEHLSRLRELQRLTELRVGSVVDRGELSRVAAAIAGVEVERALAQAEVAESLGQLEERVRQPLNFSSVQNLPTLDWWFGSTVSMQDLTPLVAKAPIVLQADWALAKAEIQRDLADAKWRPSLSIEAIAERTEDRFGSNTDQRIALRIETPVFQGFAAFKRPKSAGYALAAAKRTRDLSVSEVRRGAQRILTSIRLQRQRAPLIQQQVQASNATVELYTQQFKVGRRDMSDLIGAEAERLAAELSKVDMLFEQRLLAVRLAGLMGLLSQKLLVDRESAA